jgi:hypothetical protein
MADLLPPISPLPDPEPALNVRALFDEGLAEVRRLGRAGWTDHNTHDPGITMLELACYALTDLAYRHALPIADRLAAGGAAQFHAPAAVLHNRAFTELDWRKRLIDLPGVKNAWFEPVSDVLLVADLRRKELRRDPPPDHPDWRSVPLAGLYRVRIEFMDGVTTQVQRNEVLRAVRGAVEESRNLGEDVLEIAAVRHEYFALCAEVDLSGEADVVEAAAQILFAVGEALAPPVPSHGLATLQARGLALPDVLEGPPLEHGFIDETELRATALPSEIRLSDVIGAAADVPGVRSLRQVRLNALRRSDGTDDDEDPPPNRADAAPLANSWRVPVQPGRLPRLSLHHGRLVFSQRGLPVLGFNIGAMPGSVATRLAALHEAARLRVETPAGTAVPAPPLGRTRALAGWVSFQRDFPALYGIGEAGLGERATPQRRAQALQLQGWLLFFDQLMADQLALLAQASQRLSVAPAALQAVATAFAPTAMARPHVLAAQVVDSIVAHEQLYPAGVTAQQLADAVESRSEAEARQQRLLDHLLARVGEDFADCAAAMASAFGHDAARQIGDKCHFLEDVAQLSHDRAGAFLQRPATREEVWNTTNVSGFERRLARLLGIADFTRRNLALVSHDAYNEVDAVPDATDEYRFRVRHAVTNAILLSSSTRYPTPEAARAEMVLAIQAGQRAEGYARRTDSLGRHYFNVVSDTGEVLARRIHYYDDPAEMELAIAELQRYLLDHYSGEGLYVVEHILLRPLAADDPLMPICSDAGCEDCDPLDPYSYRVHVVLPAYAGRFQDFGFRQFVEQTIRREMPAHLLPTVCWVGPDDMAVFEAAWRNFLELHAGFAESGRRERLQALIDALVGVKNVYPSRALFDCTGDETKPPFILGKTSLGRGPAQR